MTFYHPKYYAELRRQARLQAGKPTSSQASSVQAPSQRTRVQASSQSQQAPGSSSQGTSGRSQASGCKQQATSIPTNAQGFKLQARVNKLQDPSARVQAVSPKLRVTSYKHIGIFWMSHGDNIQKIPNSFSISSVSDNNIISSIENKKK